MQNQTANPTNNNNETVAPLTAEELLANINARVLKLTNNSNNTRDVLASRVIGQEDTIAEQSLLNQQLIAGLTTSEAHVQTLASSNNELLSTNDLLNQNNKAMSKIVAKQNIQLAEYEEAEEFADLSLLEGGKTVLGAVFNGTRSTARGLGRIGSVTTDAVVGSIELLNGAIKQAQIEQLVTAEANTTNSLLKIGLKNDKLRRKLEEGGISKETKDMIDRANALHKQLS